MYIIYIFSSCLALCVGYIVNDLPPKSKYHFPRFGVIFTLFSFVNHVFFIVFGVTFLFWLIELCINFLFAEKNVLNVHERNRIEQGVVGYPQIEKTLEK